MTPKSAKQKGRKLQQEIRDRIKDLYGFEPDTAVMGEKGKDVKDERLPYSIECKNVEKLNLWKAWKQAKDNLFEGDTPVVVFTKNRPPGQREKEDRLAVVPLDWFLERMDIKGKPDWQHGKILPPAGWRPGQILEMYDDDIQPKGRRGTENHTRSVPSGGHGRGESRDCCPGRGLVCRSLEALGWIRPGTRGD